MCGVLAWWVALAEVGGGEPYEAFGPLRFGVVAFGAAAGAWVGWVQSALARAFALFAGAGKTDGVGEVSPAWAIAGVVDGH